MVVERLASNLSHNSVWQRSEEIISHFSIFFLPSISGDSLKPQKNNFGKLSFVRRENLLR